MECTENRKFDLNDVPDKLPEEAWAMMKKASDEKDLEDFRDVSTGPMVQELIILTMDRDDRLSRSTPRLFPLRPFRRSKRRCVRKTSRSTSSDL